MSGQIYLSREVHLNGIAWRTIDCETAAEKLSRWESQEKPGSLHLFENYATAAILSIFPTVSAHFRGLQSAVVQFNFINTEQEAKINSN